MVKAASLLVLALVLGSTGLTQAEDAYYDIPLRDLQLVEGRMPELPRNHDSSWQSYQREQAMNPYAVVDGPGEAYFWSADIYWGRGVSPRTTGPREGNDILLRAPAGKEIKGRLVLPKADASGMDVLRFVVPASAAKPEAKEAFYGAKEGHYVRLAWSGLPGGAWFRHQERLTATELKTPSSVAQAWRAAASNGRDELADTYELFTGGRAISENLQLDRTLPQRVADEMPVKIDSLPGITIGAIDWKPLIKDARPELDPLAAKLPFDQHVVFFPSFQAALAVSDETKQHDTPLLRLARPRSEDEGVVERYQRQLGLPLSTLARLLGPTLVKSVALTGSDPSFPLGTDVAVLLETPQPATLDKVLLGRIAMAAAEVKDAKAVSGTIDGLAYQGFVAPDRVLSSYAAELDGAVVVTNSTCQLQQLAAVRNGKAKSLAALPEYTFFRIRYPRGDGLPSPSGRGAGGEGESALIFLSDDTIRRWCGPRWRIADSRRTCARAVMAEAQAAQLDALVTRKVEPGPLHTDLSIPGGGTLRIEPKGVVSSDYGTLNFMTPIAEMPLDVVTQSEAAAYQAWRAGYQQNWNWAFDPIGLRLSLGKQKLAADLTIMPLISGSAYDMIIEASLGAKLDPRAGDPHQTLAQLVMALNHKSMLFQDVENLLKFVANVNDAKPEQPFSLGWVGPSISVYADDDRFWDELAKVPEEKLPDFIGDNFGQPVAVRIDSTDPVKLAAFLASFRTFVEQTSPGLTKWETLNYKEQAYVRISLVKGKKAVPPEMENQAIYYTTAGGALTVTPSQRLLEQAIDRISAEKPAEDAGKTAAKPAGATPAWLGSNVALHVDSRILEIANVLGRRQYQQQMQIQCWNNLPILNEWKRLYPDRDPVAVHQQVWGVTLVCPGGGKYVWNEKYGTMESTVYGHPGEPKEGPAAPPVLSGFARGDFGLTLENQGLRARVELQRGEKK
jgi:hypothetical protein